jgi:chitin synthase
MIVYILAIPVFSFAIPIYAFWHFDDFSWGNTRIVVGEKGQKKAVGPEEGNFDPETIPTKRWSEHEEEMMENGFWEKESQCSRHSKESECSCQKQAHSRCSSAQSYEEGCSVHSHSTHHSMPSVMPPPPRGLADMSITGGSMYTDLGAHFNGMNFTGNGSIVGSHSYYGMPSDVVLVQEIEKILDQHDLMQLTKKQVRDSLSEMFGVDMSCKKDFINKNIDQLLAVRL